MRVGSPVWARWEVRLPENLIHRGYEVAGLGSFERSRARVSTGAQAAATPERNSSVAWTPCWSCFGRRRGEGDKLARIIQPLRLRRSSSRCRRFSPTMYQTLGRAAEQKGLEFLACPVLGTPILHARGKSRARKRSEKTVYARFEQLLGCTRQFRHLRRTDPARAPTSSSRTTRLSASSQSHCANFLTFCERAGVDPNVATESLTGAFAGSRSSKIQQLQRSRHAATLLVGRVGTRICFSRAMRRLGRCPLGC